MCQSEASQSEACQSEALQSEASQSEASTVSQFYIQRVSSIEHWALIHSSSEVIFVVIL